LITQNRVKKNDSVGVRKTEPKNNVGKKKGAEKKTYKRENWQSVRKMMKKQHRKKP